MDVGDGLLPTSTYVAETAAGLLDAPARTDLHKRLAELTPPAEAARHLAAAGDHTGAFRLALTAADQATGGDRAAILLFACELPVRVDPRVRLAAADAALTAGRPRAAAAVLTSPSPLGVEADVLRGEALLQAGLPGQARTAVQPVPDAAPPSVVAARDRVLLLADLADDPAAALDTADKVASRYPQPPAGVAAALATVAAVHRRAGWADALAAAAADLGDRPAARAAAWLLVETLAADGRLTESAEAATAAAAVCAEDLAYGWQTRFLAAADWALALHGATGAVVEPLPGAVDGEATPRPHYSIGVAPDDVQRRSANLADRSLPDDARAYATAATALVEADTGLLAAARGRLAAATYGHPAIGWVAREAAWLDGQPDRATGDGGGGGLLAGLDHITARWAAHDLGSGGADPIPTGIPDAARRTLLAWATGTGFAAAAEAWAATALREQIRCLLAAGLYDNDAGRAVDALLSAEKLADTAGLTVLAGRARRGLRRHHVHRDTRSPRSGNTLTNRETDVLRLVAAGEPTRRIAGQLGISAETVDTHIRAGMRKLGARTRTEAAALAFANDNGEEGQ
jgi:DNA-binding CsgD family transcriptional regulator